MKNFFIVFISILLVSCTHKNQESYQVDEEIKSKITFDIDKLNKDGLLGSPDGLHVLDYKFCIPLNWEYRNEILSIDSTIQFIKGTGSRNSCTGKEYLCLGNTHKKNFKEILYSFASLEYVNQIDQMFWEE